jgi:hypothetical protein
MTRPKRRPPVPCAARRSPTAVAAGDLSTAPHAARTAPPTSEPRSATAPPLSRSCTSSENRSPGRAAPPVPIETVVTSQPSNASDDPPDYKADSSRPSGTTLPPDATGTPSILEAPGTSPASNSHSWPPSGSPTDSSRPHRLRSFSTKTRTPSPESWPSSNRTTSITPSRRPPRDSAMPQIYLSASPPRPPQHVAFVVPIGHVLDTRRTPEQRKPMFMQVSWH